MATAVHASDVGCDVISIFLSQNLMGSKFAFLSKFADGVRRHCDDIQGFREKYIGLGNIIYIYIYKDIIRHQ